MSMAVLSAAIGVVDQLLSTSWLGQFPTGVPGDAPLALQGLYLTFSLLVVSPVLFLQMLPLI